MVKVPVYAGRTVGARAEFQQGINVQTNAGAFGADIGQGMQQIGQGLGQAADAMARLRDFDDTNAAKDADLRFANWSRERMYGEGGFLTTEGRNAVDGRAQFEAEAEQKRKEFSKGLSGGASRAYDSATQQRMQSISQQSITHTAAQRKAWFNDTANGQIDSFANDALAGYKDGAVVNKNIAAGQSVIREQARMGGWPAEKREQAEREFISGTQMNVALRMLADDPITAEAYYKANKGSMTGAHQFKFEESLKVPLQNAHVLQHTSRFFSGGDGSGGGSGSANSSYFAAIRTAESGGNDAAKNPRSSATGRYQFIQSTWEGLMRKRPDLGLTADGRLDPGQQERAIRAFTDENAGVLSKSGIAVTNGTLYAAHFLGSFGAVRALRASPEAAMADVVSPGVIDANPFLRGMTVGQFSAWAERKGGGEGGGRSGGAANAGGTGPMNYNTIEPYLATISDPAVREATRKSIYAQIDSQQKLEKTQREGYQTQAFNLIETQNISPFSLPPEITTSIGQEGMSQLMTYWEKRQSGMATKTDDVAFANLQEMYARDPASYAEVDLFKFKGVLSDADWKRAQDWKQTALTDQRKAQEEGANISTAMGYAKVQFDAVHPAAGTGANNASAREARAKQEATFQRALMDQMQTFIADNKRQPTQADIVDMTNTLLFKITYQQPGALGGMFGDRTVEGRMYDVLNLPQGAKFDTQVEIVDIPAPTREHIRSQLQQQYPDRTITDEMVVQRYEDFKLGRPVDVSGPGAVAPVTTSPLPPVGMSQVDMLRGRSPGLTNDPNWQAPPRID